MTQKEKQLLTVRLSPDLLTAQVYPTKIYEQNKTDIDRKYIEQLLKEYDITYGIDENAINHLLSHPPISSFPITIAKGTPPKKGEDGKIIYEIDVSSTIEKTDDWDFRDIMRIPSVKEGDLLARIVPPTKGEEGISVTNTNIEPIPGKPYVMRAGKNVEFNDNEQSFYAILDGQVIVQENRIDVQPVYEVHGDLSMEIGNIDFVGSVIIHGDVPAGFTIQAGGDVQVYGIVEAATIISKGTIYIYEGFAGLQKGLLKAEKDIHIGYMNQGKAEAKGSIYVNNSILHSECTAGKDIVCQQGNIIGGNITAAGLIRARDIGNRLYLKTNLRLAIDEKKIDTEQQLLEKKKELQTSLHNLKIIKEKLLEQKEQNAKIKQLLQRQQLSYNETKQNLQRIDHELETIQDESLDDSKVIVDETLYPNTAISFGKYQRVLRKEFDKVQVIFKDREIKIETYHH